HARHRAAFVRLHGQGVRLVDGVRLHANRRDDRWPDARHAWPSGQTDRPKKWPSRDWPATGGSARHRGACDRRQLRHHDLLPAEGARNLAL
ncbi:uncharacterized protein METZ01_LOCUS146352, partial [marine metagenome]